MTARPPLETLEAASDESPTSPSTGEGVEGDSEGDSNGQAMTTAEQSEASISKTLEAILSKTDDDDESPLTAAEGAISFASASEPTAEGASSSPQEPAVVPPSISVDAMFDVDVDLGHGDDEPPKWSLPLAGDDRPVGDLLDEVADALKVQAAESRERAIGRAPEVNAAGHPPGTANTPVVAKSTEFEFEDPEDGPTTLNSTDEANGLIAAATANRDEDEEAVVLGPATRRGDSHPNSSLPGGTSRATLPAPPMPGTRVPGSNNRATPFAGLPAPTLPVFPAPPSGRARLPTPAPGHPVGVPAPGSGRSAVSSGSPPAGTPDVAALSGFGLPDSSRRITRATGSGAALGAGASATRGSEASAGHRALGLVAEPLSAALSSASTILKKDVRFRLASLAAIVLVTFAGGLLIGRAALRGKEPEAQPAVARAADPVPPPAAKDPEKGAEKGAAADPTRGGAAAPTTVVAAPAERPKIEPVAPPPATTVAEATQPGVGPMQFEPQPIHKRRARRSAAPSNEDPSLASAPKGPVRVASIGAPPSASGKGTAAGKSAPKKKSTWHDPFAD
jgi:hypothetical protein